MEFYVTIDTKL